MLMLTSIATFWITSALAAWFGGTPSMASETAQDDPRVTLADGARALRATATVNLPVGEAWRLWTTSDGVSAFMGVPASVELKPGGRFEVYFAPDAEEGTRGSEGCTVLGYLPHRWLSFTWNAPPTIPSIRDQGPTSQVTIEFTPLDETHTRVSLTHHGFREGADWDAKYEYFARAWPSVMAAYARHAATLRVGGAAAGAPDHTPYRAAYCYLFVEFSRPDLMSTLTDDEKDAFARHFAYLQRLTAEGRVVLAGPCTDLDAPKPGPGIVILATRDEAEARRIMEGDPVVAGGVLKAELHPFRISLLREWDRGAASR